MEEESLFGLLTEEQLREVADWVEDVGYQTDLVKPCPDSIHGRTKPYVDALLRHNGFPGWNQLLHWGKCRREYLENA